MDINLSKDAIMFIGIDKMIPFGVTRDFAKFGRSQTFDLMHMTRTQARKFQELVESGQGQKDKLGREFAIRTLEVRDWMRILEAKGDTKIIKLDRLPGAMKLFLRESPKHWIYEKAEHTDDWQPYFVDGIAYEPAKWDRKTKIREEFVTIEMCCEQFGKYRRFKQVIEKDQAIRNTPEIILAKLGYKIETPELLASYEYTMKRYAELHAQVGLQCEANGTMEVRSEKKSNYWWSRSSSTIVMQRDGVPARVVIDVLKEGEDEDEHDERQDYKSRPCVSYWEREPVDHEGSDDDDDDDIKPGDEDPVEDQYSKTVLDFHIPILPSVMLFDLKRHQRVEGRIEQITPYKYRDDMMEKLILPDDHRDLVRMMIQNKAGFQDIVGNKGNGAIVLCAGGPGTGKTLTAEVYSEGMQRPLYSVQCSQIGLKPDEIEEELLKVFARANRWNAILLLDEADVYIMKRGSDLVQNAIVGVFLRILEYYQGLLFMTTNRGEDVDDAIASRCLARISYETPGIDDQKKIWRALANTSGLDISDAAINTVANKFNELSGRDVKNLLKLAGMVASAKGIPIDAEIIETIKRFKPTN